jgi:predicted ATPase
MIKSLEIRNFRCFKDLYLTPLKRFNIVVGDSGSGKTALLEALFLLAGASPELWMRLRQWRGFSSAFRLTGSRASYESLFREIFFNFQKRRPAALGLTSSDGSTRSLKISYPGQDKLYDKHRLVVPEEDANYGVIDPIVFVWKTKGREVRVRVDVKGGIVQFGGGSNVYPVWFSSPAINEATGVAGAFSELSMRKKTDDVVKEVQNIFSYVRSIGLESIAGDLSLCAEVDHLDQRIPVGMISSGLNRYLSLMIAIAQNPNGILLIDEFEVGFYYGTLPTLLESICSFCEKHGVQIIATTHSYSFLEALLPSMKKRQGTESEFSLLRAERDKSEASINIVGDPSAAIEGNFEVR